MLVYTGMRRTAFDLPLSACGRGGASEAWMASLLVPGVALVGSALKGEPALMLMYTLR